MNVLAFLVLNNLKTKCFELAEKYPEDLNGGEFAEDIKDVIVL